MRIEPHVDGESSKPSKKNKEAIIAIYDDPYLVIS